MHRDVVDGRLRGKVRGGARLDNGDRDELPATGTADTKATATDLFDGGPRPAATDHVRGRAAAPTGADGRAYRNSYSRHSVLPRQEPGGGQEW
jgi:hypothetical protein